MKNITVTQKWNNNQTFDCVVDKNKSIKIDCIYKNAVNPKPTSILFKVGDVAEYDSYNLSYIGLIVGITEKTVTIQPDYQKNSNYSDAVKRLKLEDFCWRNWDFNIEKKVKENSITMMYI
jgi:hypothetical protein